MSEKGLFLQNVIAVIWDFDKTLSPHYMQKPLFEAYDIDEHLFWDEVNALPDYYRRANISIQADTCYLGHLLAYVRAGRMPGLNNAKIRELGAAIEFYPGIPDLFKSLEAAAAQDMYEEHDLRLEHYVVSTGLVEIIRGSQVAPHLEGIYGSEFIETPATPGFDPKATPKGGVISQIASFLDNTTKTRALFEINKGVNKEPSISVNDTIPEDERRVPFKNMIYIADGPSDIPSFSVVKKHGGQTCAVYANDSSRDFKQALALQESGRVAFCGPADYREGTHTYRWLHNLISRIADRIISERKKTFNSKVSRGPSHSAEVSS